MTKILILGIDGMDSIQVSKFENYLPNFKKLKKNSHEFKMESVFPPDSIPAWGSIYTGLNPAEHGIVNFIDPNNDEYSIKFNEIYKSYFGKTFWDFLSSQGKKVCILLPYSIYPPWPVNGAMVCRSLEIVDENYPLKTYPPELYEEFHLSDFNVNLFHGFPSKRKLELFLSICKNRTLQEAELGLRFIQNYPAELYFIYFSALDAVQHTFWNYCDNTHPDYPGENKFQNSIKDFYILMDDILGKYLSIIDDETAIIVLSDHGHGMRPVNLVNINEILRRKGYLNRNVNVNVNKYRKPSIQKEKIKKICANSINYFGIGNTSLKIINKLSFIKHLLSNSDYIVWENTVAYLSAISGIKSYSEGGILINKNINPEKYEITRDAIITDLKEIIHPESGKNLMKWIKKREDLYCGEFISKYPDIVFQLDRHFGVGWDVNNSIIGKSSMSNFQSGSHLGNSPVLIISNIKIDNHMINENISLMKILDLILMLMETT